MEEGTILSLREFVYDLVLLIWPTQPLAVIEVNVGTLLAIAVAIGANTLLFAAAGVVAGVVARRPRWLLVTYIFVCALVLTLALWGFGLSFEYLHTAALLVALVLYALPFWAVFRFTSAG